MTSSPRATTSTPTPVAQRKPPGSGDHTIRILEQVRQIRRRLRLSLPTLAQRCDGLTVSTLRNLEIGRGGWRKHLTVDELFILAAALEVPPAELLMAGLRDPGGATHVDMAGLRQVLADLEALISPEDGA